MKSYIKVITSLVLAIVVCALVFGGVASAHTASEARASGGPTLVLKNIICCGESDVPLKGIELSPQTSGSITDTFTTSNSYSASVGVSVKAVSATLGFDVTQTYSLTASCSATNTTSQFQHLTYYAIFTTYDFEIWQGTFQLGEGSANQYAYDQCFYGGSINQGNSGHLY